MVEVAILDDARHLFVETFQELPNFENQLLSVFKKYKESNGEFVPNIFGRDVPYRYPIKLYKLDVSHIHLRLPPDQFSKNIVQIERRNKKEEPNKDIFLVYVKSQFSQDKYALLAILRPNAHEQSKQAKILDLFCEYAEKYQNKEYELNYGN